MPSRLWRRHMWRRPNQPPHRYHDDLPTQLLNNTVCERSSRANVCRRYLDLVARFQREAALKGKRLRVTLR